MPVLPIALNNIYNHINYLVYCSHTGEAAAIDPFDVELVHQTALKQGLAITKIINTHEHWDHAGRNQLLAKMTGAKIYAHKASAGFIEHIDHMLSPSDVVTIGQEVALKVLLIPGHTMTHIGFFGEANGTPFLISGDTLFGAGVGNCDYGGHAPTLYDTVYNILMKLPDETKLYPGHDYLKRNLQFTLFCEPDNEKAAMLSQELPDNLPDASYFTTMGIEKQINCFMRLNSEQLRATLFGDTDSSTIDSLTTFCTLRKARDDWIPAQQNQ